MVDGSYLIDEYELIYLDFCNEFNEKVYEFICNNDLSLLPAKVAFTFSLTFRYNNLFSLYDSYYDVENRPLLLEYPNNSLFVESEEIKDKGKFAAFMTFEAFFNIFSRQKKSGDSFDWEGVVPNQKRKRNLKRFMVYRDTRTYMAFFTMDLKADGYTPDDLY